MASTIYGRDDPQTNKRWSRRVEMQVLPNTILGVLGGRSEDHAFYISDELEKEAGDRIRKQYLRLLTDEEGLPLPAIEGQVSPEGREKAQQYPTYDINIDMTSQATRFWRVISEQRVAYKVRDKARIGLSNWWIDFMDIAFFHHAAGYTPSNTERSDFRFHNEIQGPSADHRLWANDLTSDEAVAGDPTAVMTKEVIDDMVFQAEVQHEIGNFAMGMPLVLGEHHWVLVISTRQHNDLRKDPAFIEQLMTAPTQGGEIDKNIIRTRYKVKNLRKLGIYNDVCIFVSHRIPRGVHSGTGEALLNTRRAVLLGSNAVGAAFGRMSPGPERYFWTEWSFPYKREMGIDAGLIGGMSKVQIGIGGQPKDLATIVATTYAQEANS